MSKYITVTVDPTGKATVEAHGFKGKSCTDATKDIEAALGIADPASRRKKAEYFQSAATTTTNTTRR